MNYVIKGKGTVSLNDRNFLASGGEGSVYVKGSTAFKIYADITKTIPEGKIYELSAINKPNIVKPTDIILNDTGKNCGYTMQYINRDSVFSLCELFPKAFKERNQIKLDTIVKLVRSMQSGIQHCHDKNILLVDINEMNFLVPKDYSDVFFIDTDSYQTPSYHATAIMDGIRDRHCEGNKFTEGTDWFSFGIVSFNMFAGIHPFKGKHQTFKTLDERMMHDISVLNKDVSYPAIVGDFTQLIPQNYLEWYKAIFEKGVRCAPPVGDTNFVAVARKIMMVKTSDNFITNEVYKTDNTESIVDMIDPQTILTTKGLFANNRIYPQIAPYANIIKTPKLNHILSFIVKDNMLKCFDVTDNAPIECDFYASGVTKYNNRLYIKQNNSISEMVFVENGKIIISAKQVANISEFATQMFDGCAIQNLLGRYHMSVFPESGIEYQIKLPKLDGHRLLNARYDNHVCVIVSEYKGEYYKSLYKINDTYSDYVVDIIKGVDDTNINFIVLDNGICINETTDGYVGIFNRAVDKDTVKIIPDTIFQGNKLFKQNNNVFYTVDNKLFSARMK